MKRTKKFVAVLAIVSLSLSSVATSYADTAVISAPAPAAEAAAPEAVAPEAAPAPEVAPAPAEVTKYADLTVADKHYYGYQSIDQGVFPVVEEVKGLEPIITEMIWKNWTQFANDFPTFYSNPNSFSVSYLVENFNRYAKITVNLNYNENKVTTLPTVEPHAYFVDKFDYSIIDEATYDAGIAAQTAAEKAVEDAKAAPAPAEGAAAEGAAAGEAAAEKPLVLMQVRSNCTALGYTLQYDADTKEVIVLATGEGSELKTLVKYTVGVNKYIVDDKEIELEAAPVIQDDNFTYVPASFFTEILKVKVQEKDGVFTVVTE